jgi:hypothetical protein
MKVKTADLIGPALDWAVAALEGLTEENSWTAIEIFKAARAGGLYWYSTDWSQGGPIIERENIDLISSTPSDPLWQAMQWRFAHGAKGPTPLIAAMRCFVASRLGYEVDVPDELV